MLTSSHALGDTPKGLVGTVCPDGRALLARRGVDVHLGGVEALMSQDVLYLAGAGAVLGQAGGHRVAQCVDRRSLRDPGADAGPAVGLAHEVLRSSSSEALALAVDEEGRGGASFPLGVRALRVER